MSEKNSALRGTPAILGAVALVAGVAAAVLYGKATAPGKAEAECPPASKEIAARMAPLAKGEIAALSVALKPRPAIALTFNGPDGAKVSLADFRGRALILNLWATWCVPCRAEMPAGQARVLERIATGAQAKAVMRQIAQLTGGDFHTASTPDELAAVYTQLGDQIGYQTTQQDITRPWLITGTLLAILGSAAALAAGRRIP